MGKIVKVTSKTANDSILQKTVAKAQKKIAKRERGKAIKAEAKQATPSPKQAERTSKRKQRRIESTVAKKEARRKELGVLYVSHVPHGFYEDQLKKFFGQFGQVTRVRLVRSTISGRSKGHAFVVFKYKEVAQIAAETANNYLMGKRILKARVIPPDEVKGKWFFHTTPRKLQWTVASKRRQKYVKKINETLTPEEGIKRLQAQKRSLEEMVKKLNQKGIDYKFNAA